VVFGEFDGFLWTFLVGFWLLLWFLVVFFDFCFFCYFGEFFVVFGKFFYGFWRFLAGHWCSGYWFFSVVLRIVDVFLGGFLCFLVFFGFLVVIDAFW